MEDAQNIQMRINVGFEARTLSSFFDSVWYCSAIEESPKTQNCRQRPFDGVDGDLPGEQGPVVAPCPTYRLSRQMHVGLIAAIGSPTGTHVLPSRRKIRILSLS